MGTLELVVVFVGAFLVIASIFGGFCGYIAEEKGRSKPNWTMLGFLFGLIALIAVAGVPSVPKSALPERIERVPQVERMRQDELGRVVKNT